MIKVAYILVGTAAGGAERYVADLVARLDRDRFYPIVLGHAMGPVSGLVACGVRIYPVLVRKVHDLSAVARLAHRLRQEQPDIVHTHDNRANLLGRIAARWAGSPVVLSTIHTSPLRTGRWALLNRLYRSADRWTARYADLLIGTSDFVRDQLVRYLRVQRGRTLTVYPGVDLTRFDPACVRPGQKEQAVFRMAVVGRLEPERRHEVVLEVAARVAKRVPDIHVYILGAGSRRQYLEGLAERFGLAQDVTFLGYVDDVPSCLEGMDVVVSAAGRESFGIALAEAMAMAIPVVAVDVGGVSELIRDGVDGILVPDGAWTYMADALTDLARNSARARRMGAEGRRRIEERFRLEDMAERMMRVYEACLDGGMRNAECGMRSAECGS